MTERSVYQPTRLSPTAVAVVVALHAAGIGGLMLWKIAVPDPQFRPTETYNVPYVPPVEPTPPPPQRSEDTAVSRQAPSVVDQPPARVPAPADDLVLDTGPTVPLDVIGAPPGDLVVPQPRVLPVPVPVPVPEPVRVAAEIDPRYRSSLRPPYPASEQRNEREGSVRLRVTIGTDGRVKAAEQLSATSDAFWETTRAQALRHWRFRPATVDGQPVESQKVMTVTFRLSDL